jgi:hypothetical protein
LRARFIFCSAQTPARRGVCGRIQKGGLVIDLMIESAIGAPI